MHAWSIRIIMMTIHVLNKCIYMVEIHVATPVSNFDVHMHLYIRKLLTGVAIAIATCISTIVIYMHLFIVVAIRYSYS